MFVCVCDHFLKLRAKPGDPYADSLALTLEADNIWSGSNHHRPPPTSDSSSGIPPSAMGGTFNI